MSKNFLNKAVFLLTVFCGLNATAVRLSDEQRAEQEARATAVRLSDEQRAEQQARQREAAQQEIARIRAMREQKQEEFRAEIRAQHNNRIFNANRARFMQQAAQEVKQREAAQQEIARIRAMKEKKQEEFRAEIRAKKNNEIFNANRARLLKQSA